MPLPRGLPHLSRQIRAPTSVVVSIPPSPPRMPCLRTPEVPFPNPQNLKCSGADVTASEFPGQWSGVIGSTQSANVNVCTGQGLLRQRSAGIQGRSAFPPKRAAHDAWRASPRHSAAPVGLPRTAALPPGRPTNTPPPLIVPRATVQQPVGCRLVGGERSGAAASPLGQKVEKAVSQAKLAFGW